MKRLTIILAILAISIISAQGSYAAMDDKSDRLSNEQSGVFSPGYINATMQKTREIINQTDKNKSPIEMRSDAMDDKLSNKVAEDNTDKPKLELKKKTGGSGEGKQAVINAETTQDRIVDSTGYNVNIGSGTDQRDMDGNLVSQSGKQMVSEIIDETRYVYAGNFVGQNGQAAGYAGTGAIQNAVAMAKSGDTILVANGTYSGNVSIGDGIRLYGGYAITGSEYSKSTILGTVSLYSSTTLTELSGFTINSTFLGISALAEGYGKIKILNNVITGAYYAIDSYGKVTVENNDISYNTFAFFNGGGNVTGNNIHDNSWGLNGFTGDVNNNCFYNNNRAVVCPSNGSSISNNTFYDNTFGIIYDDSTHNFSLNNNIFSGNSTALLGCGRYPNRTVNVFFGGCNYYPVGTGNIFYGNTRSFFTLTTIYFDSDAWDIPQLQDSAGIANDPLSFDSVTGAYISDIAGKGYSLEGSAGNYGGAANINVSNYSAAAGFSYNNFVRDAALTNAYNKYEYESLGMDGLRRLDNDKSSTENNLSAMLKNSLGNNSGMLNIDGVGKVTSRNTPESSFNNMLLTSFALGTGQGIANMRDMETALAMAKILHNPTSDQKTILDAIKALLGDAEKAQDNSGNQSPDLKKATDDFLQVVASILIAQAIPDLFKEGDISNIKSIFAELNDKKGRMVLEYNDSTKPYYDQIVKEISKNMSILQLKNILSGNMSKEQLERIPRNELDKILEKIRQAKDKSFEEEYILQQEAKYRKAYIEPNKKILEDNMKGMMKNFTGRLSKVLESAKK